MSSDRRSHSARLHGDHSGHHHHGAGKHSHSDHAHDWHSKDYVEHWVARDGTRDDVRRRRLNLMIELAPHLRSAPIRVLDVGAGYGAVTEEVLKVFPRARITLQDYSNLMIEHARKRLAQNAAQVDYVLCDLATSDWPSRVGGPFDLIVTAIAIHNLNDHGAMGQCYSAIARLLTPGGVFLDYDIYERVGGVDAHMALMNAAGFSRVEKAWQEAHAAILVGRA